MQMRCGNCRAIWKDGHECKPKQRGILILYAAAAVFMVFVLLVLSGCVPGGMIPAGYRRIVYSDGTWANVPIDYSVQPIYIPRDPYASLADQMRYDLWRIENGSAYDIRQASPAR